VGRKVTLAAPLPRAGPFCYEFPRPALTVDCALFGWNRAELVVLLVRRGRPPFEGAWALPGGFVEPYEPLEAAARRELAEETGVAAGELRQLAAFGDPGRDPRGHTVSVVFYGVVALESVTPRAGSDADAVAWQPAAQVALPLAFDHRRILEAARERLADEVTRRPTVFDLLPRTFTLSQVQAAYEQILGKSLDKRNFRKKLAALDILRPATGQAGLPARRGAQVFELDREATTIRREAFRCEL